MSTEELSQVNESLFAAFRADHALLGAGLHELASRLRARDLRGARDTARRIDRENGAHIAFEEQDFYPALTRFLGEEDVARMYREHDLGLALITQLCEMSEAAEAGDAELAALLDKADAMQDHVAECGELFGAMGGLDPAQKRALLERLEGWRERAPTWREAAARRRRR